MAKYILKQAAIFALTNEANTHSNPIKRAYTRAAAIIEQITAEDVQPVNQWISVKDRLPEEIGYYLVVIGNEMLISIDIAEYSEGYWHIHDKVLYWQPLPEPPKDGDME